MNEIFQEYGISVSEDVTDIFWRSDKSTPNSALFYQYHKSENSLELFNQRCSDAKYGVLITSGMDEKSGLKNHFNLEKESFMELQQMIASKLYPINEKTKFIGVTGTNGKTTTVNFMSQILYQKEIRHLSIGTLGILKDNIEVENFSMTTPPLIDIYKIVNKYQVEVDYVLMELSSHSLSQERVKGIDFCCVGWTSFSQDHLDYHSSIEEYFDAKLKIIKLSTEPLIVSKRSEIWPNKIETKKVVNYDYNIQSEFLKVSYNLINLDVAVGLLESEGIETSEENINNIQAAPGRFNVLEGKNKSIVIDYAHTPDAIENVCKAAATYFKKSITTVFGCGGDRDKTKRPLMLEAALKFSDHVIVTSDNPRFEDPAKIIEDVLKGTDKDSVEVIEDRKTAIYNAICVNQNEVVLILGKGHENYLDIKGTKHIYSDEQIVKEAFND